MDINVEPLISLRDAAALMPGRQGKARHWKTLWRWARVGLGGILLETVFNGGDLCTSVAALQRFIDARTRLRRPTEHFPVVKPTRRSRGYEAAVKRLREIHGVQ